MKVGRTLRFEQLEDRRVLSLVVTETQPRISSVTLSIHGSFLGYEVVNSTVQPTTRLYNQFWTSRAFDASSIERQLVNGAVGANWINGYWGKVDYGGSVSVTSTLTQSAFDEGGGIRRYEITRVATVSREVHKNQLEVVPLPPNPTTHKFLQTSYATFEASVSSGGFSWSLTDPLEYVVSQSGSSSIDGFDRVRTDQNPTTASATDTVTYTSRETVRIGRRSASLESVKFQGGAPILPDPGTNNYLFESDPDRKDYEDIDHNGSPDEQRPVLYAAGSVPILDAVFHFPQGSTGDYTVRGIATGGFHFHGEGSVSDGRLSVQNMHAKDQFGMPKTFGAEVTKYGRDTEKGIFAVEWKLTPADGGEEIPAGQSENTLYLSATRPQVTNFTLAETPQATGRQGVAGIFETVVDIAVTRNLGRIAADVNGIILGTWSYFDSNDAVRVDGTTRLKYWGGGSTDTPSKYSTPFLLKNADGKCNSWAYFFLDVLAVNGVTARIGADEGLVGIWSRNVERDKDGNPIVDHDGNYVPKEFLLINQVDELRPGRSGVIAYPFFWDVTLLNKRTQTEISGLTDIALRPIGAQNNLQPIQDFTNHAIVRIGGRLYDPSYGESYGDIEEWEEKSLAGFVLERTKKQGIGILEVLSGHDFNGNGTPTDAYLADGRFVRLNRVNHPEVTTKTFDIPYTAIGAAGLPQGLSATPESHLVASLPVETSSNTPVFGRTTQVSAWFAPSLSLAKRNQLDLESPTQAGFVEWRTESTQSSNKAWNTVSSAHGTNAATAGSDDSVTASDAVFNTVGDELAVDELNAVMTNLLGNDVSQLWF
jgi:hypothetical protein